MKKTILVTGAAGFVGHHCVDHLLKNTNWNIIILDSLNYAGNMNRITDSEFFTPERVKFVWHDLKASISESVHKIIGKLDYCIHFAAESHVDRSLEDSIPFVMSNVVGTANLLEYFKHYQSQTKTIIFSCYDEKTKAFTRNGRKNMYELKEGDLVLTINPVTKALEEQPIKRVIIQDYEGEMIEFKNSFINLLVTPNHRIYTEDMRVIEAKDCLKEKVIRFPRMNPKSGKEEQILIGKEKKPPEEIFYLIGVFLGDGFLAYQKKVVKSKSGLSKKERDRIAKDKKTGRFIATGKIGNRENVEMNSWRIYFDIPENDRCRKKVEETLEKLSIKFHKQKGKAGEHLYFTSKEWFKFFEQFKKGARNKFIPDWIFDYDGKYLKKLFEGLIDSDGRWENLSFSTVSKALAEGISQLAIRIGYYPNIQRKYSESIFERRVIKGWSYYLNFNNGRKTISNKFISKKFYKGKIWCIEVKNKNFLVERDGKFAFCGNTDEVFGPAPEGVYFKEEDRFKPSNPYSASKAGEEMIAYSFAHAFGLPTSIVRSMNIIGERQHPEKFLPKTIKAILNNAKIALHGKGREDLSSRCWIHARNVADGLLFLLDRAEPKEFYHIVGEERTILEMADWVCEVIKGRKLKDDEIQWIDYFTARPGHDKRYALSGEKLAKMGWRPPKNLEESLKKTVKWTLGHQKWLNL